MYSWGSHNLGVQYIPLLPGFRLQVEVMDKRTVLVFVVLAGEGIVLAAPWGSGLSPQECLQ